MIEELVTRYTAGETVRALSREYGVSRSWLCQLLQSEGVALREQGITPEDAEMAIGLYESGLTIRQVVDKSTIHRLLKVMGVAACASRRWMAE